MKKYLILGFAIVMMACSDQRDSNLAATKKLYDHFNAHDWKAMADMYTENAEFLDPIFGTEYAVQTRQQIVDKYTGLNQMFPDAHDEIKEIDAVDDKVIVQFVATGNSGDSIRLKLPICSVLTFKDGKIVRDASYYDNN